MEVYVDGWDYLRQVTRDVAGSQVQAMLKWETELLESVLVHMKQCDNIRAVDSILSIQLNKVIAVSECATINAYLEAVGIAV
jgi:hypothetical protein